MGVPKQITINLFNIMSSILCENENNFFFKALTNIFFAFFSLCGMIPFLIKFIDF